MFYYKKSLRIVSLLLTGLLVTACELSKPSDDPQTICTQLKRQFIYYQNDRNIEAKMTTGWQKEELLQKLKEHHCKEY